MGSKQFICSFPTCQKCFKRPDRLTVHIRTHTGEKPYTCSYNGCTKSYARQAHLQRHTKTAHKTLTEDKQISNSLDGKCCTQLLTSCHLTDCTTHTHKQKPYICPETGCGRTFKKHHQLKVHGYEHTHQKPFCCNNEGCGKSFIYPSALKRHLKYHEGYLCSEARCEAWFSKWILLVKHRKSDHPKEYKCSSCDLFFHGKYKLRVHQKVHQENRDMYQCPRDDCKRSYLDKRNLSAHIKSFHEGKRFTCFHTGCQRSFVTKQKLHHHTLSHDPNRISPPVKVRVKKKRIKRKHRQPQNVKEKLCGIQLGQAELCESEDALLLSGISEPDDEELSRVCNDAVKCLNSLKDDIDKESRSVFLCNNLNAGSPNNLQLSNFDMHHTKFNPSLVKDILQEEFNEIKTSNTSGSLPSVLPTCRSVEHNHFNTDICWDPSEKKEVEIDTYNKNIQI